MRLTWLVLVVLLVTGACGTDAGSGDLSLDRLASARQDAWCELFTRCRMIDSVEACRPMRIASTLGLDPEVLAAARLGTVVYHADQAQACNQAIETKSCQTTWVYTARDLPVACDQIFTGTVAGGGSCLLDAECISQQCQPPPTCTAACCVGTCIGDAPPSPHPALGDSCAADPGCIGSFCDPATQTCVGYLPAGAACTSTWQCQDDLFCGGSTTAPVCEHGPAEGEPCTLGCTDIGEVCHSGSRTCAPAGLVGDPCTSSTDCAVFDHCDGTSGTCAFGPLVGDPCTGHGRCLDLSYCDPTVGRCLAEKPDGSACNYDYECTGGYCDVNARRCATLSCR